MTANVLVQERADNGADDGVQADWESPAGREAAAFARLLPPVFVFHGPGDVHWIGQPCDVIDTPFADPETRTVVLACGCRARVPSSALRARPRPWV